MQVEVKRAEPRDKGSSKAAKEAAGDSLSATLDATAPVHWCSAGQPLQSTLSACQPSSVLRSLVDPLSMRSMWASDAAALASWVPAALPTTFLPSGLSLLGVVSPPHLARPPALLGQSRVSVANGMLTIACRLRSFAVRHMSSTGKRVATHLPDSRACGCSLGSESRCSGTRQPASSVLRCTSPHAVSDRQSSLRSLSLESESEAQVARQWLPSLPSDVTCLLVLWSTSRVHPSTRNCCPLLDE